MLRRGTIIGFYTFVLTGAALLFMGMFALTFGPAWGCFAGIVIIIMFLAVIRYTMIERNNLIDSMKGIPGFQWKEPIKEEEQSHDD